MGFSRNVYAVLDEMVKIILVVRNGLELRREFSQKPLGYLITLKTNKQNRKKELT